MIFLMIFFKFLLVMGLFMPLLPLVVWSFAEGWYFPRLWPPGLTLTHWQEALAQGGPSFTQSTMIALLVTILSLAVGVPAGRALGMSWFRGRAIATAIILLPVISSPLSTVMGLQFVLIRLGLSSQPAGIVLAHLLLALPYTILVCRSVFANFAPQYEAQARCLGASPWQTWWCVTFPMVLPGILVSALWAFLVSWHEFLLTFLLGGGWVKTLPMVLYSLLQGGDVGLTSAVALLSLSPALLLLYFVSRRISLV